MLSIVFSDAMLGVMERLNFHHLFYFWRIAREGGMARAAAALHVSQPTLSGQLALLERDLGEKLFTRAGRRLELTEVGRVAFRYAEEIFGLGHELVRAMRDPAGARIPVLQVGVADVLPKLVTQRLLEPALAGPRPARLVVREDRAERLFAALALHDLDLVLADAPPAPGSAVRVFSHLLGESPVALYAAPVLAVKLRRRFPASLQDAPMLLPGEGTTLRRQLESWLDRIGVSPRVVGEFDDSALLTAFAQAGHGVIAAPAVVAGALRSAFGLRLIGPVAGASERFYAVSAERRIQHPGVAELTRVARRDFSPGAPASRNREFTP
jgi:LysR family transcriptional activator of nhaA